MYNEFVYVLKAGPYFKIGRTTDINKRIAQLSIQLPFETSLFKVINCDNSTQLEHILHQVHHAERVNGEWFELTNKSIAQIFFLPSSISTEDADKQIGEWEKVFDIIQEETFIKPFRAILEEVGEGNG